MEIIVASQNSHKIDEMSAKFGSSNGIFFLPMNKLPDYPKDIIENGTTFEENAIIKAQAILPFTDKAIIADDSGLVVDALNGEPGIYSARYKGCKDDTEKNRIILDAMTDVPDEKRTAHFICVLAYLDTDWNLHTFTGICAGLIHTTLDGSNGFGYDPIFYLPEYRTTMADILPEEKNRISHRALALDKFHNFLNH
ncbi:MAG: RdgB/HAM1 family non-canonical purine NTP pyrophosphatase [Spirochaetes bacterium]|jgi:XTP/dITP diphosphohydrolase|nr:RdgB/HAM1 family non-canonical purine NTP pyrophosphatase [Spirochaetota bacterium]